MLHFDPGSLSELAYAAALDDSLWIEWAQEMVGAFGCDGALFATIDRANADVCRSYFLFDSPDYDKMIFEYFGEKMKIDPQMAKVCSTNHADIYRDIDHLDPDDPETRDYLAWQVSRVGTYHHMTAFAVVDDTLKVGIALHRTPSSGVVPDEGVRRMKIVFPHFARAARLGFRHHQALDETWWDSKVGEGEKAMILLDELGCVLRVSEAAKQVIAADNGLSIRKGRVTADAPAADRLLQRAIAAALRTAAPEAGGAKIAAKSGTKPYQLFAYPLVRKRRFLAPFEGAALVQIVDPNRPAATVSPTHRTLFGLSDREMEVANLLVSGHSPESLSAVLQISPNTARIHLRSLFRKTETNRQSELVRVLLGG